MTDVSDFNLAAIVYETGDSLVVDALLTGVAERLARRGLRLAGAVQDNPMRPGRRRCDMQMTELSGGGSWGISEDRGPEARGCRLDVAALETLSDLVAASLDEGTDLLIVNKFGKREAAGRGLAGALARAVELGVPVLTAVGPEQRAAWDVYTGQAYATLPSDNDAIVTWVLDLLSRPPTRTIAKLDHSREIVGSAGVRRNGGSARVGTDFGASRFAKTERRYIDSF